MDRRLVLFPMLLYPLLLLLLLLLLAVAVVALAVLGVRPKDEEDDEGGRNGETPPLPVPLLLLPVGATIRLPPPPVDPPRPTTSPLSLL